MPDNAEDLPRPDRRRGPAAQESPLRAVPGGYDIATWPVHVPLEPGEHPVSWLIRLGHRLGTPPRDLLRIADPAWNPISGTDPSRWPTAELARLARVDQEALESARRSSLHTAYDDYLARHGMRPLRTKDQMRYCPHCLADSGVWESSWAHPLHLACIRHGITLFHACGNCGRQPWWQRTWTLRATPVWQCTNRREPSPGRYRRRAPFCDRDLREQLPGRKLRPSETRALAWLLDLVQTAATDPGHEMAAAGAAASVSEVLDAAFEILTESLDKRRLSVAAAPVGRIVEALETSHRILTAPGLPEALQVADRRRVLSPTGQFTPIHVTPAVLKRRCNPVLTRIRFSSLRDQLDVAHQLMLRTGSPAPRHPVLPPAGSDLLAPAQIPQILWPGALDLYTDGQRPHTPAVLSIALAKVGSMVPLRVIAIDLGLPAGLASYVNRWWLHLGDSRHDLVADLDRLYAHLEQNPPQINYRRRRLLSLDPEPFQCAAAQVLADDSLPHVNTEPQVVARHLWRAYTGSFFGPTPALGDSTPLAPASAGLRPLLATAWLRLPVGMRPPGEPFTWSPRDKAAAVLSSPGPSPPRLSQPLNLLERALIMTAARPFPSARQPAGDDAEVEFLRQVLVAGTTSRVAGLTSPLDRILLHTLGEPGHPARAWTLPAAQCPTIRRDPRGRRAGAREAAPLTNRAGSSGGSAYHL